MIILCLFPGTVSSMDHAQAGKPLPPVGRLLKLSPYLVHVLLFRFGMFVRACFMELVVPLLHQIISAPSLSPLRRERR
jgi:hypothetical protein